MIEILFVHYECKGHRDYINMKFFHLLAHFMSSFLGNLLEIILGIS
jgi:hypothetical protein